MCEECASLRLDLVSAWREYRRLRDLLIQHGISIEESDERDADVHGNSDDHGTREGSEEFGL